MSDTPVTSRLSRAKGQVERTAVGRRLVRLQWNLRKAVRQPGWAYRVNRARVRRRGRQGARALRRTWRRTSRRLVRFLPGIGTSGHYRNPREPEYRSGSDFSYHRLREAHASDAPETALWNGHLDVAWALSGDLAMPKWLPLRRERSVPDGIALATVCTDKFVIGLEAFLLSLRRHHPDFDADVIVFHDGRLSPFAQQRLVRCHPRISFEQRAIEPFDHASGGDAPNHLRIGSIGYLNLEALSLRGYRRVVIVDADLLVTAPISEVWEDPDTDDIRVVADAGNLPLTTVSTSTKRVIFNSGVISVPSTMLRDDVYRRALDFLPEVMDDPCPLLRRFADQRFWNLFVASLDVPVTYLPAGINANKRLIEHYYPSQASNTAIVHYTAAKPWFGFASRGDVSDEERSESAELERQFPVTFRTWRSTYESELAQVRLEHFRDAMGDRLGELRGCYASDDVVLIGNGPSIAHTDLDLLGERPRIAFNWFVNHPEFDRVRPDHLVLMSHMFYGGWFTFRPEIPERFIERLRGHAWKPEIWAPYYFRDFLEDSELAREHRISYLLFEKPFKRFADDINWINLDPQNFLTDCRTGVLTAGCPLAAWFGAGRITLVGCDSSYGQAAGATGVRNDYFYASSDHASASTREESLTSTWTSDGPGQQNYALARRMLADLGVDLVNATVGGSLQTLPRVPLASE